MDYKVGFLVFDRFNLIIIVRYLSQMQHQLAYRFEKEPKTALLLILRGAAVAEWLSSWLAEQEGRGSIPGLAT